MLTQADRPYLLESPIPSIDSLSRLQRLLSGHYIGMIDPGPTYGELYDLFSKSNGLGKMYL